ncbi:DUF4390 domain-containing protein [Methylomonas sp. SURF-2]|uniref:DUF4390 domain-containing protein n=1 Tax=Methylomonas subterranea TaxID=2952225 RepID=A0ABT1TK95_9GAMM|nr:DUF4390 domain-containing protein [Methylomonas sp. SURF-2]MCQ8105878.1 DUF4390 domain-containing protein [Methylomonas sp. SURF-2]
MPSAGAANPYAAIIRRADLVETDSGPQLQAQIDYQLSPSAKEALHKGIALNWRVLLKLRAVGRLWDRTVYSRELPYRIRFHALLNQYEVLAPNQASEMFLTLNAALGYMSNPRDSTPLGAISPRPGQRYYLAVKCQFEREDLPVPLRPFAYLDPQWFLSSDWTLWPIQK